MSSRLIPTLSALGIFLFANAPARGQITSQPAPQIKIDEKELAKHLKRQEEQKPLPQAVEGAIDPAAYLVGPGDIFKIDFWGPTSDEAGIAVAVTPTGTIIIPTVGVLDVNGKSLAQVQEAVRRACEAQYDSRTTSVTTNLLQLRLVRVHIYGEVKTPGSYNATAVDRISYFIQQAEGWTEWANERNVELRHPDGRVDTLDMYQLYSNGDVTQNPQVRGGEVIYVPRIALTEQTVFIEGEVEQPGPHQIARGETLLELLYRVKALNRLTDFNELFLVRQNQAPQRARFFHKPAGETTITSAGSNHSEKSNGVDHAGKNGFAEIDAGSAKLEHGDRILVTELKGYVYVHGAVKNPGNVPFVEGFKAVDYVGFAGGTQEMANLGSIRVVHSDTGKSEKGPNRDVHRGDTVFVPVSGRVTLTQYFLIASQIATLVIAASAVGIIGPGSK